MALSHRLHGHAWTLAPHVLDTLRPPPVPACSDFSVEVDDGSGTAIALTGHLTAVDGARAAVVVVHGLGGDADSVYMRRAAAAVSDAGLSCLRINLRGADRRGEDFYHAGLTADLHSVLGSSELAGLDSLLVLGYSLGGHMTLRAATEGFDPRVRAVAAVCSPLDLDRSAMAIDRPALWLYRSHVLRGLKEMYASVARRREVPLPAAAAGRIRWLRDWDDQIVAPRHGFDGATDYYERMSAGHRLDKVSVPALIVAAEHDPMVPAGTLRPSLRKVSDLVDVRWTSRGGHVGFPSNLDLGVKARPGLERQVVHWLARHV